MSSAIITLFFAIGFGVFSTLTVFSLMSSNRTVRKRLEQQVKRNTVAAIVNGTFQNKFSTRRTLSVACGLKAKKDDRGIKISPQGRMSREAIVDSFSSE